MRHAGAILTLINGQTIGLGTILHRNFLETVLTFQCVFGTRL
jgi:hypothetical protein